MRTSRQTQRAVNSDCGMEQNWATRSAFCLSNALVQHAMVTSDFRFADDIMLIATTLPQLSKMMEDLTKNAAQQGLQTHREKIEDHDEFSKQHNRYKENKTIDTGLPHDCKMKYLGQMITFHETGQTELQHRIRCACKGNLHAPSKRTHEQNTTHKHTD